MTLATANLILRQIQDMLVNPRFLQQSKVGLGNHSRREISNASLLVVALDYWIGQVTGLDKKDKGWNDAFSGLVDAVQMLPLQLTKSLVPPDEEFIDLSKLRPDSEQYMAAYEKMHADAEDRYSRHRLQWNEDEWDREDVISFLEFLNTLPIHPSLDYWKAVYERVKLPFPDFDPDRPSSRDKLGVWDGFASLQTKTEAAFNRIASSQDRKNSGETAKSGCMAMMAAGIGLEELIRHMLF